MWIWLERLCFHFENMKEEGGVGGCFVLEVVYSLVMVVFVWWLVKLGNRKWEMDRKRVRHLVGCLEVFVAANGDVFIFSCSRASLSKYPISNFWWLLLAFAFIHWPATSQFYWFHFCSQFLTHHFFILLIKNLCLLYSFIYIQFPFLDSNTSFCIRHSLFMTLFSELK